MTAKYNRLGLYVPWAAFILVVAAWCVYWHVLKNEALKRLDAAIVQLREAGVDAGFSGVRTRGFPTRLTFILETVWLDTGGARFEMKKLPVSINLVSPRHLIIDLQEGIRQRTQEGRWRTLSMRRGAMSVRFTQTELARLSVDLEAPSYLREDTGETFAAERVLAHVRPDERAAGDLQLALEIEGASLPTPVEGLAALGTQIQRLNGLIVIEKAADAVAAQSVKAWKRRGALRFEVLDTIWGTLGATGTGRIAFDAKGKPQGALRLKTPEERQVDLVAEKGGWRLEGVSAGPGPSSAVENPAPLR